MKPELRWTAVMACALAAIAAASATAQEYPQRPIRMIVGLPAGGSTDLMGRLLAAKLGERFGQQVVFDNRPGASGRTRAVNRAPACGM
jgi:tripartite-type tricarboxylate transporter receptor subunit TctC